jgi:hypothetical protein
VREVDQLQDAVDERVAERDEGVEGAVRQPDQEDAEEGVPVLDQVDDKPGGDEADQRQPERGNDEGGGWPATPDADGLRVYLGSRVGLLMWLGKGPRALPQSG